MSRPRCNYWNKCFRTDAAHKKLYLHPGDKEDATPSKKFDLQGKRIIFTGKLTNETRKQAEFRAKEYGCFVGSSLSKNIDVLIAGSDPGGKIDKAKALGVKVYTEDEWKDLLKQSRRTDISASQESESEDDTATIKAAAMALPKVRKRTKTHDISDDEDSQDMEVDVVKKTNDDGDTSDTDVDEPSPAKKTKTVEDDDAEAGPSGVPKLTRSRSQSMTNKPRCKFWEKCYRKNDDHLKDFSHPHDLLTDSSGKVLVSSFEMPKKKKADMGADANASTPLPLHFMKDGEKKDITGGLRGEHTYTIKRTGDLYYCTCTSWKAQGKAIDQRTCRHLKNYLGEEYEMFRIGKTTGGPGDEVVTRSPRHKAIGSLLLAHKWTPDVDPVGWWMSEKLDGVRAYWDGKTFYSRLGNEFIAPSWFTKDYPADMALDGELFGGRGKFQSTVSIVKTAGSGRWNQIKYYIFDAPNIKKPFEGRMKDIKDYFNKKSVSTVTVLDHVKCISVTNLKAEQKKVEDKGGEGLMIREPKSMYEHRRSKSLLKIKSFHDAEAVIIGYEQGKGRNASVMGAVVCRMECGKTFKVGSGFTDAQRRSPPKKGSIITYRFQEYTNSGSPRFPTYVGIRIDMDGPKDVILPKKGD